MARRVPSPEPSALFRTVRPYLQTLASLIQTCDMGLTDVFDVDSCVFECDRLGIKWFRDTTELHYDTFA